MTFRITSPERLTQLLLSYFVIFVALVQALVLGFNMVSVPLTGFLCLGILAGAFIVATGVRWLALRRSEELAETVGPERSKSLLPRSLSYILAIFTLLVMSTVVIAGYVRGDTSYDGNAYHMLSINQWAAVGHVQDVDRAFETSPFVNGYPKGAETVAFVWARAFGPRFIGMLNLIYAPIGFLGIALLCQLFGAGWQDSLVLGACYLLVPANLDQYGSTLVDGAFASSVIALLALLALFLRADGNGWDALLIGCGIGNVIAIKGTGPLIAVASVGSFLVCDAALSRKLSRAGQPRYLLAGTSSVVAIAVGGFWYLRNYAHYRNPLYPVAVTVRGHNIWPGLPFATIFKDQIPPQLQAMHPLIRLFVSWLAPFLRLKPWYHPVELGALGELWVLACIPAIMASWYFLKKGMGFSSCERAAYCLITASLFAALLGTPLAFKSRLTMWLFGLGMPSICLAMRAIQGYTNRIRRLLNYWVTGCVLLLIFQAAVLAANQGTTLVAIKPSAGALPFRIARRQTPLLPLFPDMRSPVLKEILHTDAAIAVGPQESLGHARRIHGQIAQPIGRHYLVPLSSSIDAGDMARLYSVVGLQYILWLTDRPIPPVLAQNAAAVESDGPFTLLRLNAQPGRHGMAGAATAVNLARCLAGGMGTFEIWRLHGLHPFSRSSGKLLLATALAGILGCAWNQYLRVATTQSFLLLSGAVALVLASYVAALRVSRFSIRGLVNGS